MTNKLWAAFGNLLSSLRDRAASTGVSTKGFDQAQGVLDGLHGVNADVGFYHKDDGSKVYTCSIRLLSGNFVYGHGDTLAIAVEAARTNPPVLRREAA